MTLKYFSHVLYIYHLRNEIVSCSLLIVFVLKGTGLLHLFIPPFIDQQGNDSIQEIFGHCLLCALDIIGTRWVTTKVKGKNYKWFQVNQGGRLYKTILVSKTPALPKRETWRDPKQVWVYTADFPFSLAAPSWFIYQASNSSISH